MTGKNWRGGTSKNIAVTKSNALSSRLWGEYDLLGSWDAVAKKNGVSKAMAFRAAHGYEPHKVSIRRALGLPVFVTIAVCQKCGLAHTAKRCARRVKSFEENAANYDRWLAANAGKLAEIVAWACLASEQRQGALNSPYFMSV